MTILNFGSFGVGIIDIVIVLSVILFLVLGWKNGFLTPLINMASGIFGIVGSILLARPFVDLAIEPWFGTEVRTRILEFLNEKLGTIAAGITPDTIQESVQQAFPTFPKFLQDLIAGAISPDVINQGVESIINSLVEPLTGFALVIISFLMLFLGSIVVFFFLKIIAKMITSLPIVKQIDKILGLLFGMVKIALLIFVLFFVLGLLFTIPPVYNLIGAFVETDMALSVEQFRLSKWLYNNNILSMILGVFL